jgi:hypothetical protein
VDSGSDSIYEFDLNRGRFLGPAPRVNDGHNVITLPGYPTPVGSQPPQTASIDGKWLLVAGGNNGTLVEVPISEAGLGTPVDVSLPSVPVRRSAVVGGGPGDDRGRFQVPFIEQVIPLGPARALAVTQGAIADVAVAYLIDLTRHQLLGSVQLGDADAGPAIAWGGDALILLKDGTAVVVDPSLSLSRSPLHITDNSTAWSTASSGRDVYIATGQFSSRVGGGANSELDLYDPTSGQVHQIVAEATTVGGPLAAQGQNLWWGHPDKKTVEKVLPGGGVVSSWNTCAPNSLARWHEEVLVTCVGPGELDIIDASTGQVTKQFAGGFPRDVVVAGA